MMKENQRIMELLIWQSTNQVPLPIPQAPPQQQMNQYRQRSPPSSGGIAAVPITIVATQGEQEVKVEKLVTPSSSESARHYGPPCYNCGQKGHYRNECSYASNQKQQQPDRPPWQRRYPNQPPRPRITAVNTVGVEEEQDLESSGTMGTQVSVNMVEVHTELVELNKHKQHQQPKVVDEDDEEYVEIEEVAAVGNRGRESSSGGGSGENKPSTKRVRVKGKLRKKRRNPLEIVIKPPRMMENEEPWDYVKAIRDTPVVTTVGQIISVSPVVRGGLAFSMIVPKNQKKGSNKNYLGVPGSEPRTTATNPSNEKEKQRPRAATEEKTTEKTPIAARKIAQPVGLNKRTRIATTEDNANGEDNVKTTGRTQVKTGTGKEVARRGEGEAATELVGTESEVLNINQVIAEPTEEVVNFHTEGKIEVKGRERHLHRILIDGGSVVNLIPDVVARELGLTFCQSKDRMLTIRTATGNTLQIRYYARFDVNIAGVIANVRAYIIPRMTTYTLLLGRRWMKQVRASGNYREGTYQIEGFDGRRRGIPICNREGAIRLEGEDAHVHNVVQDRPPEEGGQENHQSWLCESTNRALLKVMTQSGHYSEVGGESEEIEKNEESEENEDEDDEEETEEDYEHSEEEGSEQEQEYGKRRGKGAEY